MADKAQIINIIETIHMKKKGADINTILKEAKGQEINLSNEDIKDTLNKLCEENILKKVQRNGKFNFHIVNTVVHTKTNDSESDISSSEENILETGDFSLKKNDFLLNEEISRSEDFNSYANYLKELSDLKKYIAFEMNNLNCSRTRL